MKTTAAAVLILFLCASASPALAEEWQVIGGRARGMGGAGVAVENNPYWNPASIYEPPKGSKGFKISDILSELDLSLQGSFELSLQGDVVAEADDIIDLMIEKDFSAVQARLDAGTADMADVEFALVLLKEIEDLNRDGEGVYTTGGGSAYVRLGKNLGLSIGTFVWSAADPYVDLSAFSSLSAGGFTNLLASTGTTTSSDPVTPEGIQLAADIAALGVDPDQAEQLAFIAEASGLDLTDPEVLASIVAAAEETATDPSKILLDNKSGLTLTGLILSEVGISFSLPVLKNTLSVGATVKLLHGITYRREFTLQDVEQGQEIIDETYTDFKSHQFNSFSLGLDLGAVFRPLPLVTFGICAKNLTHPSFPVYGTNDFVLYPQVRAGVLVKPVKFINLALDFDVVINRSEALSGFESQMIATGVELVPIDTTLFGIALRTGAYRNLAMKAEEIVWTAGFSVRLWAFEFELSGASSAYSVTMSDIEKATVGDPSDPNPLREVSKQLPERLGLSATLRFIIKF